MDTEQYATPHLSKHEKALVMRLMEDYPNLDQMMAETIVWDYFQKEAKEGEEEEEEECNEAKSGTVCDATSSPHQTSAPSSASVRTPPDRPPCAVLEGATTFVETTPPDTDA